MIYYCEALLHFSKMSIGFQVDSLAQILISYRNNIDETYMQYIKTPMVKAHS